MHKDELRQMFLRRTTLMTCTDCGQSGIDLYHFDGMVDIKMPSWIHPELHCERCALKILEDEENEYQDKLNGLAAYSDYEEESKGGMLMTRSERNR